MPTRRAPQGQPIPVGLMANGSSGSWDVALDETTAGPDRWFVQIEGPTLYLSFEIASTSMIHQVIQFLAGQQSQAGSNGIPAAHTAPLKLGTMGSKPLHLIRDDEFDDRCFLVLAPNQTQCIRLKLAGDDLTHLLNAFRQVQEDLE